MVKKFDMRAGEGKNLHRVKQFKAASPINCGLQVNDTELFIAGCADGNIVAFNLAATGAKPLYGYGADP